MFRFTTAQTMHHVRTRPRDKGKRERGDDREIDACMKMNCLERGECLQVVDVNWTKNTQMIYFRWIFQTSITAAHCIDFKVEATHENTYAYAHLSGDGLSTHMNQNNEIYHSKISQIKDNKKSDWTWIRLGVRVCPMSVCHRMRVNAYLAWTERAVMEMFASDVANSIIWISVAFPQHYRLSSNKGTWKIGRKRNPFNQFSFANIFAWMRIWLRWNRRCFSNFMFRRFVEFRICRVKTRCNDRRLIQISSNPMRWRIVSFEFRIRLWRTKQLKNGNRIKFFHRISNRFLQSYYSSTWKWKYVCRNVRPIFANNKVLLISIRRADTDERLIVIFIRFYSLVRKWHIDSFLIDLFRTQTKCGHKN